MCFIECKNENLGKDTRILSLIFPEESCNIYYLHRMSIMEFILTFHPEESSWESKNMFFNEQIQKKRDWDLANSTFLKAYPFAVIVNFISSHSGRAPDNLTTTILHFEVRVSLQSDKQIASALISVSGIFVFLQETSWIKANLLRGKICFHLVRDHHCIHPQTEKWVALSSRTREEMHKCWTSWWAAFLWEGRKSTKAQKNDLCSPHEV